jgi:hypothetical protein
MQHNNQYAAQHQTEPFQELKVHCGFHKAVESSAPAFGPDMAESCPKMHQSTCLGNMLQY